MLTSQMSTNKCQLGPTQHVWNKFCPVCPTSYRNSIPSAEIIPPSRPMQLGSQVTLSRRVTVIMIKQLGLIHWSQAILGDSAAEREWGMGRGGLRKKRGMRQCRERTEKNLDMKRGCTTLRLDLEWVERKGGEGKRESGETTEGMERSSCRTWRDKRESLGVHREWDMPRDMKKTLWRLSWGEVIKEIYVREKKGDRGDSCINNLMITTGSICQQIWIEISATLGIVARCL